MRFSVYARQPQAVSPVIPVGFRHDMYEPFFSFGSGTGLFPCKRPLDQQKKTWPIVVQDYDITFQRRYDRGLFGMLSHFETIPSTVFNDELYVLQSLPMTQLVQEYSVTRGEPQLIVNITPKTLVMHNWIL